MRSCHQRRRRGSRKWSKPTRASPAAIRTAGWRRRAKIIVWITVLSYTVSMVATVEPTLRGLGRRPSAQMPRYLPGCKRRRRPKRNSRAAPHSRGVWSRAGCHDHDSKSGSALEPAPVGGQDLFRELRVRLGNGAREHQCADHVAELLHGARAGLGAWLARRRLAEMVGENADHLLDGLGEARLQLGSLAGSVGRESAQGTPAAWIIAVLLREVIRDVAPPRVAFAALEQVGEGRVGLAQGCLTCLLCQRLFRGEVIVEAAMGEAGLPHQVGDAYALEAVRAKETLGRLEDGGAVLLRLLLGQFHRNEGNQAECAEQAQR